VCVRARESVRASVCACASAQASVRKFSIVGQYTYRQHTPRIHLTIIIQLLTSANSARRHTDTLAQVPSDGYRHLHACLPSVLCARVPALVKELFVSLQALCVTAGFSLVAGIKLGQWSDEPDSEGRKHRTNNFVIALNASFGPKSTPSVEKQVITVQLNFNEGCD